MPRGGGEGNPDSQLREPDCCHHTRKMRLHTIFIAVFLALAALPASAGSKTASSLDRLFGALHATTDPDEANRLTGLIWVIWNHAEDPETDRLMTEGREAMERLDFDTALARFTAVVEREPNFAEGWNKRATLYYVMGRYRDSIGDIDRVLDDLLRVRADEPGAADRLAPRQHVVAGLDRQQLPGGESGGLVTPVDEDRPVAFAFFVRAPDARLLRRAVCSEATFIRVGYPRRRRGWDSAAFGWLLRTLTRVAGSRKTAAIVWSYRDRTDHGEDVGRYFTDYWRVERALIRYPLVPNDLPMALWLAFGMMREVWDLYANQEPIYLPGRELNTPEYMIDEPLRIDLSLVGAE